MAHLFSASLFIHGPADVWPGCGVRWQSPSYSYQGHAFPWPVWIRIAGVHPPFIYSSKPRFIPASFIILGVRPMSPFIYSYAHCPVAQPSIAPQGVIGLIHTLADGCSRLGARYPAGAPFIHTRIDICPQYGLKSLPPQQKCRSK